MSKEKKGQAGHHGAGRSDKASGHPTATKSQEKVRMAEHENIVWLETLQGLTLRQIADRHGFSKTTAGRLRKRRLRKMDQENPELASQWLTIQVARSEDRTRRIFGMLDELKPEGDDAGSSPTESQAFAGLVTHAEEACPGESPKTTPPVTAMLNCIAALQAEAAYLNRTLGLDATKHLMIEGDVDAAIIAIVLGLRDSGRGEAADALTEFVKERAGGAGK